jgi:hypothetical protein
VLASLLMADELHDTRIELESLRAVPNRGKRGDKDGETGRRLGRLAVKAEQIAADLEQQGQTDTRLS